eukprot:UN01079
MGILNLTVSCRVTCASSMFEFLRRVRHPHVQLEVETGIAITGYKQGHARCLQEYPPDYGEEYELPHIQSFSLVHNTTYKEMNYLRSFPPGAKLELLAKMQHLKQVHFVRLIISSTFLRVLAVRCPHVETLAMSHCQGHQNLPIQVDGSHMKGFH